MVIGHCLYGVDNNSFMIDDRVNVVRCSKCGFITDFNFHNPFFVIKKTHYDYSHPYDIGTIVSLKFKEFCLREGYRDITFLELERCPGYFQFYAQKIVTFDAQRANTKQIKYCSVCNNYEQVIGSNPAFLKDVGNELDEGFYRTDLVFGVKDAKNPVTVVGPKTFRKLKLEKLKGLIFKPIEL
jgi:hypothetical protein